MIDKKNSHPSDFPGPQSLNTPSITPTPSQECRVVSWSRLFDIANVECNMSPLRIGAKIGIGVLLTIAIVLLFPLLAIAIAIAQGLSKDGANWIFVLSFLRRDVVNSKKKEEDALRRALWKSIKTDIDFFTLENYKYGSDQNINATYSGLEKAVMDPAPCHRCNGEEAKDNARNFLGKSKETEPAATERIPDNFFADVDDGNVEETDFCQKLVNAVPGVDRFQIVLDCNRDNFWLSYGENNSRINPRSQINRMNVANDCPEKSYKLDEGQANFLNILCRTIYRAYSTNEARVLGLRTFLSMPYAQGPFSLAMMGQVTKIADSHTNDNSHQSNIEQRVLSILTSAIQRQASLAEFHFNEDASITVRGSGFCVATDEFRKQMDNQIPKHSSDGPPFAHTFTQYTCTYGRDAVIDDVGYTYRY